MPQTLRRSQMTKFLEIFDITKPGRSKGRQRTVDMTEGNVFERIIRFSMPLLLGYLLQQFYTIVDAWVVGQFAADADLPAIGIVAPVTSILIGIFMGISTGAGVVIAQYYGARRRYQAKIAVHTAFTIALIMGAFFMLLGIFGTPFLLRFMNVDESMFGAARTYLTVYSCGIVFLAVHNMGTAILGAVGDHRRPLFFMISAGLNIFFDLLFVIVFKMGVFGVALATVLAQGITAALVFIALLRDTDCIKIIPKKLGINFEMSGKIFRIGIPAAFQLIIVAISEVLVQRYFNRIPGTEDMSSIEIMSGYTIYTRIEEFLLLPIQALSVGITNFVGQNAGKEQHKRARRGTLAALGLSVLLTTLLVVLLNLFTTEIVSLFNSDENVIRCGVLLLRFISPFYLFCCFIQIFTGSVSGIGRTFVPMIILVTSFIGARQLYLYAVTGLVTNSVVSVGLAYPLGWICAGIAIIIYYALCEYDTVLLEAELAMEAELAAKAEFEEA